MMSIKRPPHQKWLPETKVKAPQRANQKEETKVEIGHYLLSPLSYSPRADKARSRDEIISWSGSCYRHVATSLSIPTTPDGVQLHLVKERPDRCRFFLGRSLAGYHNAWEGRSKLILHGSGSSMRTTRFQSISPLEFPPESKLR